MPKPIQVEKRFAKLVHSLDGTVSFKSQWTLIYDFLHFLEGDYVSFDTYCLQLIPHFPVFRDPLSFSGCDPEFLLGIDEILTEMRSELSSARTNKHLEEAHHALKCAILFIYNCLGDLERGIKSNFGTTKGRQVESGYALGKAGQLLWNRIERLDSRSNEELLQCLKTVLEWWKSIERRKKNTICVPVIERQGERKIGGRLRKLSARIAGYNKDSDIFENHYAVIGAEKGESHDKDHVIRPLRSLISSEYPDLSESFYKVHFTYEFSLGFQEGRSSELALGIMGLSTISGFAKQRKLFQVQPFLAVSGLVEASGEIKAIDPDSIKQKTEAAFFSWMRYLVVPEEQKHQFETAHDQLLSKYPHRRLQVIGLSNFEDFIFDRRIIKREIQSRPKYYAKKAWNRKFTLAGNSVILVLLVVIARLLYGPLNKNPVRGLFEGSKLHVYNKSGALVKSFEAGYRRPPNARQSSSIGNNSQVHFHDLNNDGINEVFWGISTKHNQKEVDKIMAWSISGDSLIWKKNMTFKLNFPRKNSIVDDNFKLTEFFIQEVNGKPLVVSAIELKSMFPAMIVTFDALDGKVKQKYIHPGHFYDLARFDITGDGIPEIIATGVNNAYWKAAITVLDVQNLQGHAPIFGDYVVDDFEKAEEVEYLLIPKTILGKYFDPVDKYNRGMRIKVENKLLTFEIEEARPPSEFPNARRPYILGFFNSQMKPVGFGTSDSYDILAKGLYQEGKISFIPDYDYFEAFIDSLLYWDGDRFVRNVRK